MNAQRLLICLCFGITFAEDLKIELQVKWPQNSQTMIWPVSVGVPFGEGVISDADKLTVIHGDGTHVPNQVKSLATWKGDGLRWCMVDFVAEKGRKYFLTKADEPKKKHDDDLQVSSEGSEVIFRNGTFRWRLNTGNCVLPELHVDLDKDGEFTEEEALIAPASSNYSVVDSKGRTGLLKARELKTELMGSRHTVLSITGDYLDSRDVRLAATRIYYHFYAGVPQIKISHKFIVTEDTNELWFRDIGMRIGFGTKVSTATATLNDGPEQSSVTGREISANEEVVSVQSEFPHFGSSESQFKIIDAANPERALETGEVAGDWCDLSSKSMGLAVQLPGFAQQFPKAFRLSSDAIQIKFWASESKKELDYRTRQIVKNYFGHDWIPENHASLAHKNNAQGTAKIHDVWLYPHVGAFSQEIRRNIGGSLNAIYAAADPEWTAATGAFGPIHHKDTKNFAKAEGAIEDYFDRTVLAPTQVFPQTGYLYWGMYPYTSWEFRKTGEWYPHSHRLSRFLEYNLRRSMWVLYARSGNRKYRDYAKRYTRCLGGLGMSNWDSTLKPAGWFVMGEWHSPINWGHFHESAWIAGRPEFRSPVSNLSWASCTDVIQFVHDYFLTGDFHSRDMARLWIDAMSRELAWDIDKALVFYRLEAFLRILGSAYELEQDQQIYDFADKLLRQLVRLDDEYILNPDISLNYSKWGDLFSAFYYFYVSTKHPLAKKVLVRLAEHRYRTGKLEFVSRSNPMLQACALAYEETKDERYAQYLKQAVKQFCEDYQTLEIDNLPLEAITRSTAKWQPQILTTQSAINIGLPTAMKVASELKTTSSVPVAIKPFPTAETWLLFYKQDGEPCVFDVAINNDADPRLIPKVEDLKGNEQELETIQKYSKRLDTPDFSTPLHHSIWYMHLGEFVFYRLRLSANVPAGIYRLRAGKQVSYKLLHSNVEKVVQVAPKGLVLMRNHRYYFRLPEQKVTHLFASRKVDVFDETGKQVDLKESGKGWYSIQSNGNGGIWSMKPADDGFSWARGQRTDPFVRLKDLPLIVGLNRQEVFFDIPSDELRVPVADGTPAEKTYVAAKFGQGMQMYFKFVEMPLAGPNAADALDDKEEDPVALPIQRGTVEFWMKPLWSSTDFDRLHSTHRFQIYRGGPVSISYFIDPDNSGRTGRYNIARLVLTIANAGYSRAQLYFDKGQWYHIAVTWNVDGKSSFCSIFVNGRRKSYAHYKVGMPADASPESLLEAADAVRIGSGHQYGRTGRGEVFDELRISSVIRYTDDFRLVKGPYKEDAETTLLMKFDGSLDARLKGKEVTGKLKSGNRF
ncbi:MAG: hypothetical protein QGG53_34270 [Planctomycetota bacterium]|jgi:hypothetical protein|nr:hypothetical protein [Planctomycetota bacterium]